MALTKFNITLKSQKEKNIVLRALANLVRIKIFERQTIPESYWKEKEVKKISREIYEIEKLYEIIHHTRGSQK
jgi:hypothetical protein